MPALIVFALSFAAYAWTAAPAAGWLDSPELVAAASTLGVAHPPGHPVAVLVGRAAQLVPVGDAAWRVALASALAVAAAAALVTFVVERLAARAAPVAPPRVRAVIAAGAGLVFAASGAAWLQAVRAEVYGAEIFLCALALALLLADASPRRGLVAATFALGLALANHHYMTVLFAAPLAAWVLAGRPGWRALATSAGAAALGLLAYAALPLRALRDPLVNWGDPETASRFVWTISARAFQKSLDAGQRSGDGTGTDALKVLAALAEQLSPAGILLAAAGVHVLVRRPATRGLALALAGVVVLTAAGRALLGFELGNPDALGYLLPALLAACVLAGVALCALAAGAAEATPRVRQVVPLAAAALALLVAGWQVGVHAATSSRRAAESGDAWTHARLAALPPRAVLLSSYFETAFQVWEAQAVEQARPDVAYLDRGFATYPGYGQAEARRHPELAPALAAGLRIGAPTPVDALAELARTRPVFVELAPTIDAPLAARLVPAGAFARFETNAAEAAPGAGAVAAAADEAAVAALERHVARAAGGLDLDARRALLWHEFLRASFYCATSSPQAAAAAFARATRLSPADAMLAELAAACGL